MLSCFLAQETVQLYFIFSRPLQWVRLPVLGRCFPMFGTRYKFSRVLSLTFATAYTFSGFGTDSMFPALGTSYFLPRFLPVHIYPDTALTPAERFPALVSGYFFLRLTIGARTCHEF